MSPISLLPEELLLHIFSYLDTPPPSTLKSRQEPTLDLTTSASSTTYKTLSLVSKSWRRITLPLLFRHSRVLFSEQLIDGNLPLQTRFDQELQDFLAFIKRTDLCTKVQSFGLLTNRLTTEKQRFPHRLTRYEDRYKASAEFWHGLLHTVPNVERIVVVAPPADMAVLTNCAIDLFGDWAFGDMEYHILELSMSEREQPFEIPANLAYLPASYPGVAEGSILKLRPWTHLAINEGSFLKAYGTYEYFERGPPSLIHSIKDCFAHPRNQQEPALTALRSFTYTAILPFANHLDFRALLPQIEELDVQLAPDPQSGILDDKDRVGKAELEDTWAEFFQGYRRIIAPFRTFDIDPQNPPKLKRFICRDMRIPALREELDEEFIPLCLPCWAETEPGVFTRHQTMAIYVD